MIYWTIKFPKYIQDINILRINLNTLYFALENLKKNGYLLIEDVPEFALETWKIIKNLLSNNFELKIIKTKIFYVVMVQSI